MPEPTLHQTGDSSWRTPEVVWTLDHRLIPTAVQLEHVVKELKKWQKTHATRTTQGYYDRLQRACSWLAKAKRVTDPEARFVFSWIALNALSGVRTEIINTDWWKGEQRSRSLVHKQQSHEQEPSELEWLLWRISGLDVDCRVLRAMLEDHFDDAKMILHTRYLMRHYWDWRGEVDFKKWGDRGERIVLDAIGLSFNREKMYHALCEILVWRLRILRNQLFHGCATDTHSRRRDPGESELEAGGRLLGELVWSFLRLMASELGRAMYWPPIPYPRAASAQHQRFEHSWLPTKKQ